MALHWYATAPINFDLVRAFNPGDRVPDSIVAAHPAETTGRVIQIDVPAQNPAVVLRPLLTSDRDTDAEREAFVPARLSEASLRAAFDAWAEDGGIGVGAGLSPAATYTYEVAPDGSKRIKTETKAGVTMTYTYDDANGGRVATQSDGTTTWTFSYDTDSLITGVAA